MKHLIVLMVIFNECLKSSSNNFWNFGHLTVVIFWALALYLISVSYYIMSSAILPQGLEQLSQFLWHIHSFIWISRCIHFCILGACLHSCGNKEKETFCDIWAIWWYLGQKGRGTVREQVGKEITSFGKNSSNLI